MGEAIGPAQNHNYLYAMVQSALLLRYNNFEAPTLDVPLNPVGADTSLKVPTIFDGVYELMHEANPRKYPRLL